MSEGPTRSVVCPLGGCCEATGGLKVPKGHKKRSSKELCLPMSEGPTRSVVCPLGGCCEATGGLKVPKGHKKRSSKELLFFVPRTRLELAHRNRHYPLKVACLPISPSGHLYFAGANI